jgi:Ala-tRNA(Pro) deacylase
MTIAAKLERHLAEQQTEYELLSHPHTGCSHETAEAAHVPEDHIAKGVLVRGGKDYYLAVIPADRWLKMSAIDHELDRELELASERELGAIFPDCEVGAVPPIGNAYGVETLLDDSLTSLANVYFEAGDHEHLVHTSGENFARLFGGSRHGYYHYDA